MDESPAFNEDEVFEQRKQFFVEFLVRYYFFSFFFFFFFFFLNF